MTDSARFVADLQDAFASLQDAGVDAGGPAAGRLPLSLAFLTDLPAIYSEAALELPGIYDPPEEHLYALATAFTDEFMLQKLEYTHQNPVRRGYVGALALFERAELRGEARVDRGGH